VAPAPSVSGSNDRPVDIRERVDQDRGALKRLQLLVPGYRGYRIGEDLREADSLLRLQVSDKLHTALGVVTQRRQTLAQSGQFGPLTDLAIVIADMNRLEGEIRHAEQGWTGISPALRITPERQDRLYEYDYGFVLAADSLEQALGPLTAAGSDTAAVSSAVANVHEMVNRLERAFRARIPVVEAAKVP
jgi:hypothetical protein